MLGYGDDEVEPLTDWQQLVHPDDLERVRTALRDHLAGNEPLFESVHRLRHRDGVWLWVVSRAKARVDEQGRAHRIVGVDLDVTERKLFEEALFKEKESAQITLQSIGDGVITTDSKCRIEYLNPVAEQLTGWRLEHAQGRIVDEIFRSFHEETCEPLENPLAVAIRRTRAIKCVRPTLLIRRDGNELYIESCASPIRDGAGNVLGRRARVPRRQREPRAEPQAVLSREPRHPDRAGQPARVRVAARARDQEREGARGVVRAVPHRSRSVQDHQRQLRPQRRRCAARPGRRAAQVEDPLARHACRGSAATSSACCWRAARSKKRCATPRSLREAIRNYKFVWEERTFRLGASIGVVPISPENEDVAALLSAADSACAAAKENGRNRIYSFQENDIDLMRRRREMQWAARINNALEDGRFEIFRQTILPLQQPGAARPALRAAAAHARRGGQDRRARPVHRRGRALRPDARTSTAG